MDRTEQDALVVIMGAMDRLRAQGIPLAAEIGDRLPILYDALSALGMIDDDGDDDAGSMPQLPVAVLPEDWSQPRADIGAARGNDLNKINADH